MSKKWKVIKHGINYVNIFSPIICPECGNLIEKIDCTKNLSSEWFFFNIFKRHWSEERCTCQKCNCEISRQTDKKLEVDWSELLTFIILLFFIISIVGLLVFVPLFCVKGGSAYLICSLISAGFFIVNLILIAIIMSS